MRAGEAHRARLDANDAVGAGRGGFGDDPLERQVPRVVEDVGELLDLAARQRLERAEDPTGRADRVGHVAEDEAKRSEAGVELAVQLLSIRAAAELDPLAARACAVDGGGDGKEFRV